MKIACISPFCLPGRRGQAGPAPPAILRRERDKTAAEAAAATTAEDTDQRQGPTARDNCEDQLQGITARSFPSKDPSQNSGRTQDRRCAQDDRGGKGGNDRGGKSWPLFCSGAIPGQSPGHASWRCFRAASDAAGTKEGKDTGSSITNVEDDRGGKGGDDREGKGRHCFRAASDAAGTKEGKDSGSSITNVEDDRRRRSRMTEGKKWRFFRAASDAAPTKTRRRTKYKDTGSS